MTATLPGAPPAIAAVLERLQTELARAAGNNLAGLLVYGGLARGRYRPGKSDVNVVVLLREATAEALAAIAPALRAARRSAGVLPMILTPAEVEQAAKVFPITFLDIKEHHVLLDGEDPFAELQVPREMIRLRLVQELRNRTIRLRRRLVALADDPEMLQQTLACVARPLAIDVAALLRLAGKEVPQEDRTSAIYQAAAGAFGIDGGALDELVQLRLDGKPTGDPLPLFGRVLRCLEQLTDQAERLKEAGS